MTRLILSVPIYLNSSYLIEIKNLYQVVMKLGLMFAALGIAFCGIRLLLGTVENGKKLLQTILVLALAAAALLLIPSVVSAGVNLFSKLSWEPGRLR